jgi:hypothetical protein
MASNQAHERTSSSIPNFFLGIFRNKFGEKVVAGGEYGNRLEGTPSLDLVIGEVSVRTGEV